MTILDERCAVDIAIWFANEVFEGRASLDETRDPQPWKET
jgi:hypothetical protein